ncbi:MAG: xanthine dehydrogenase family protein molybdopterin-binding subunit [Magnetospirillum sp.]|nr:xanthine dehydrogenase family protein molybdopterin-binding subunit [Magnetospirillum sp.]
MHRFGIGQPFRRTEDVRFLTGHGRYTDDITLPGQAWGAVVRSPFAHADIRRLDTDAARNAPGVLLVLTAAELEAFGVGPMPCDFVPDGAPPPPMRPVLAGSRARYEGEALAFVVAETLEQAEAAAASVVLDATALAANGDTARALHAPELFPSHPGNVAFDWTLGSAPDVEAAFAAAPVRVALDLVNNRVAPTTLEPRGALAKPEGHGLTLITGSQGVHGVRDALCAILGLAKKDLTVVTPDVGGGFGLKIAPFPEHALVLAAARRLGRPVKWIATRRESFLSDTHGRAHASHAELALDRDGRFLALRVSTLANMGAYLSQYGAFVPTLGYAGMLTGAYAVPALSVRVRGVLTNTTPVDSYRGAGRPEAAYLIERLVDVAARDLGIDRVELRRRNFIRTEAMPYRTAGGHTYDSGDFARVLDDALARSDWPDFPARRAQSAARGRLRGIGLAYYVEISGGTGGERADLSIGGDGTATVLVGTQSTGQGHETAYAQMVATELGLSIDAIRVIQGDSVRIRSGGGTAGSRSLVQQGGALARALDTVIAQGRPTAARLLGAPEDEVAFADGRYIAGVGAVPFATVARAAADAGAPLAARLRFKPKRATFPNGCHVCEADVDPETGQTAIVRYTIVDDVGTVLNPLLLKGQIVGGAVQGIAQALFEGVVYDRESGRLRTASLTEYALPHAVHAPKIDFSTVDIPCAGNPLGVKGAGEAGAMGAPPAVMNALADALAVRHVDMPATPLAVWTLLSRMKAEP